MTGGVPNSTPISVVVPVKDEAGNVGPLAREIATALAGEPHEIVFVDDGSADATAQELQALKAEIPHLRVLRHGHNLGQSRGIRSGAVAARGGIIVTLDGDGQNDPADIPKLLAKLRADPSLGMVSGVRVKRQDKASRKLASKLGNGFRNALLGDGASDTGCGLKAFHRDMYLALPYFDHMHHRPRGAGASKYTNFGRLLVSVQDLLGVRWLQRRHRGPTDIREL
jgi:dolichol-phosphate mannosyltransferase